MPHASCEMPEAQQGGLKHLGVVPLLVQITLGAGALESSTERCTAEEHPRDPARRLLDFRPRELAGASCAATQLE